MTEGYLWTDAYPECKRVIDQGNNQSMELNNEKISGTWANNSNARDRVFIISDGLIEKLCILGEEFEPCFEGAQICEEFSFSQEFKEFKNTMFAMIAELKDTIHEGGSTPMNELEYKEKDEKEEEKTEPTSSQNQDSPHEKEDQDKDKDDQKKKYNLDEVVEYQELKTQYDELKATYAALAEENAKLTEFKAAAERKDKQAMIDSFYMLSDEDKKDVVENIDTYSLDQIEANLSVICFRNKVNFSPIVEEEKQDEEKPQGLMFNLQNFESELDNGNPAWLNAVLQNQKED